MTTIISVDEHRAETRLREQTTALVTALVRALPDIALSAAPRYDARRRAEEFRAAFAARDAA